MSRIWFTSDLHLGHGTLLTFRNDIHKCVFPTVAHMDDWLIDKWNSVVRPRDVVYVLGDVAWGKQGLELLPLHQMNGTKHLIMGNHDQHPMDEYTKYFQRIYGIRKKYGFVMSHCPLHPKEAAESIYRNWKFNIHGHIHHKDRCIGDPRYINVNVDVRGGLPVSLEQIRQEMEDANDYLQRV